MINVVEKGNALEDLKRVFESNRESFKPEKEINGVPESKVSYVMRYDDKYADIMIRC